MQDVSVGLQVLLCSVGVFVVLRVFPVVSVHCCVVVAGVFGWLNNKKSLSSIIDTALDVA